MGTDGTQPDLRPSRLDDLENALQSGETFAAAAAAAALVSEGNPDVALDAVAQHIAEIGAGVDPSALELLVETLDASGVVHRFAGSMLLDTTAVDDVAQESLISVMSSVGGYRGDGAFTSWVHPIVKRRVADHLRRARDSSPLHEELLPSARMSSMIATRAAVRESLSRLPEIYRVPVTLRDLEKMPYTEIADQLNRRLGTVKSQVSRGRALVAGMLDELDPTCTPGSAT